MANERMGSKCTGECGDQVTVTGGRTVPDRLGMNENVIRLQSQRFEEAGMLNGQTVQKLKLSP